MLSPDKVESPQQELDHGLDLAHYRELLKRRALYIIIPFVLVLGVGATVVMLLPPIYLSQGKILVESQQIPADLVRPTVTATAKERIGVIEQRVLTRENLLGIVRKFDLYPKERKKLSETELLDLMRKSTQIEPVELNPTRRANELLTIAVTVGFEHERPDLATRVANELVTLILAEDARNRTNRAAETSKFLAREVKRLEVELGGLDAQIAELKRTGRADPLSDRVQLQLATLRAELGEKASVFSNTHPDIIRLKRQIAALEKLTTTPASDGAGLEALLNQRSTAQKNLESASQKLTAARLGESLERDQFSERLEVLEQAVQPQKPVKPNRPKFLALVLAAAAMAGVGAMVLAELIDRSVRSSRDLAGVAEGRLIVPIPYIQTRAEAKKKKKRYLALAAGTVSVLAAGIAGVHFLYRPVDEIWVTLVRLLG